MISLRDSMIRVIRKSNKDMKVGDHYDDLRVN